MQTMCECYNVEIDSIKEYLLKNSVYDGYSVDTLLQRLNQAGVQKVNDALTTLKTPKRFDKFIKETNVPATFLYELNESCKAYYPTPVPLEKLDIFQKIPEDIDVDNITSQDLVKITYHLQYVNTGKMTSYERYIAAFDRLGIFTHHDILVYGRTKKQRIVLSLEVDLPYIDILEIVRYCDYWRMGHRLNAMRPRIYYYMKRASEMGKLGNIDTVESRINMMAEYVNRNNLTYVKLIASANEAGSNEAQDRIVKYHSARFQVEYD